jgi:hypothetical protein
VQAHVLRYWESEFPMLAPQKNRAGQRVLSQTATWKWRCGSRNCFTRISTRIAGAKKRLTNELRGGGKLKVVGGEENGEAAESAPLDVNESEATFPPATTGYTRTVARDAEERQGLKQLAAELRELLSLLEQETKARSSHKGTSLSLV